LGLVVRFGNEVRRQSTVFDLVTQAAHHAEEHVLRDGVRLSTFEFFTVALVIMNQRLEALGFGTEELFLEVFEFDFLEIVNASGELAVPTDKRGFIDTDLLRDAAQAQAHGAEFDEFVFGFGAMHGDQGLNELNLLNG
jgi:hypothetical protein